MIGLNTGSKWSAASAPKVISFDESGANPRRLARTLYRPGLGARRTYPPSCLLNVPATITPLGLTRTMLVPGELACDSNTWAVPLTCWQSKLGVTPTRATLSLNKEAIFIDSGAGRFYYNETIGAVTAYISRAGRSNRVVLASALRRVTAVRVNRRMSCRWE